MTSPYGPFNLSNFRLYTQAEIRHMYGLDIQWPDMPFGLTLGTVAHYDANTGFGSLEVSGRLHPFVCGTFLPGAGYPYPQVGEVVSVDFDKDGDVRAFARESLAEWPDKPFDIKSPAPPPPPRSTPMIPIVDVSEPPTIGDRARLIDSLSEAVYRIEWSEGRPGYEAWPFKADNEDDKVMYEISAHPRSGAAGGAS